MKILVTGAEGFIGKNLCAELQAIHDGLLAGAPITVDALYRYDRATPPERLKQYAEGCDFVVHLAGINRPQDPGDFMRGNRDFTARLLDTLRCCGRPIPVLAASSIQAAQNNPYGESKRAGEQLLEQYHKETGAPVFIYRLTNVFGKWCRPNYNSVVATFCHNIARSLPITVNDPQTLLQLVYIDDVVHSFLDCMAGCRPPKCTLGFKSVEPVHPIRLGDLADLLRSFRESRASLQTPDVGNPLTRKLYATYLSYLPPEEFSYPLSTHADARGSFTEILRTADRGQFSVNISEPGITKGNHWHHTKNEKFLVVAGRGIIRFRRPDENTVYEYPVSGDELRVVDIPAGYTHSIENTGDTALITFMWASECFDPANPDTYSCKV